MICLKISKKKIQVPESQRRRMRSRRRRRRRMLEASILNLTFTNGCMIDEDLKKII